MFCAYPALVLAFAPVGGAVHLAGWEKVVAGATSYSCDDLKLTRRHHVSQRDETHAGSLHCMKPNLWWLMLSSSTSTMAFLGDGRSAYEYDGSTKTMTEYRIPGSDRPPAASIRLILSAGQWVVRHPTFLAQRERLGEAIVAVSGSFVGTISAELLERLYRPVLTNGFGPMRVLVLATRPGELARQFDATVSQVDDHYVYLRLVQRGSADRLMVVLTRPDSSAGAYRLAHVRIEEPNGQVHEDWALSGAAYDPPGLTAKTFEYVPPPADWKVQRPANPR